MAVVLLMYKRPFLETLVREVDAQRSADGEAVPLDVFIYHSNTAPRQRCTTYCTQPYSMCR